MMAQLSPAGRRLHSEIVKILPAFGATGQVCFWHRWTARFCFARCFDALFVDQAVREMKTVAERVGLRGADSTGDANQKLDGWI
jgi:hypothetical protein